MKRRLTLDEYNELANSIKLMDGLYRDVFHAMTGHFPKNGKAIRKMLGVGEAISSLYYQVEYEFFQDYLEKELKDYGKQH